MLILSVFSLGGGALAKLAKKSQRSPTFLHLPTKKQNRTAMRYIGLSLLLCSYISFWGEYKDDNDLLMFSKSVKGCGSCTSIYVWVRGIVVCVDCDCGYVIYLT